MFLSHTSTYINTSIHQSIDQAAPWLWARREIIAKLAIAIGHVVLCRRRCSQGLVLRSAQCREEPWTTHAVQHVQKRAKKRHDFPHSVVSGTYTT